MPASDVVVSGVGRDHHLKFGFCVGFCIRIGISAALLWETLANAPGHGKEAESTKSTQIMRCFNVYQRQLSLEVGTPTVGAVNKP